MAKLVVAVVGFSRSGKTNMANMLRDRGFWYYAGRDYLVELAKQNEKGTGRDELVEYANQLRADEGADYLMQPTKDILRSIEADPEAAGLVVDSIRNPGEIEFLKRELGAVVIFVDSDDELRWERTKANPKERDPENRYEFIGLTAIDKGIGQPITGQNIAGCVELADIVITNNGTFDELRD